MDRWCSSLVCGAVAIAIGGRTAEADQAKPQAVQVLAYGFAGIDERDLGVMFTADLQRLDGAPRLFEKGTPKRVARKGLEKTVYRASETNTQEAGVQFLFVGLGVKQTESHDAIVLHTRMVKEVVTLEGDAQRSKQEVPADAIFYLAEVHLGTTVDLTAEADYAGTSKQLSAVFNQVSVSAKDAKAKAGVDIKVRGLGLTNFNGDGAFALSFEEISAKFTADPAPIELVFRTIPGKGYEPPKRMTAFIDETEFKLGEGKSNTWRVQPGKYKVFGTSKPNGLTAAWSGVVECDQITKTETRRYFTTCSVRTEATLTIKNPSEWGLGPDERLSLFIGRMPEQIEVADSDMQTLVNWFETVVATVVNNGKDCSKMGTRLNELFDGSGAVFDMIRRRTDKTPEWLSGHLNETAKKMMPALQKCASTASVKAALDRLAAIK